MTNEEKSQSLTSKEIDIRETIVKTEKKRKRKEKKERDKQLKKMKAMTGEDSGNGQDEDGNNQTPGEDDGGEGIVEGSPV